MKPNALAIAIAAGLYLKDMALDRFGAHVQWMESLEGFQKQWGSLVR